MAPLQDQAVADGAVKFTSLVNKLLSVTRTKICDKRLIDTHLAGLNELDYRAPIVSDSDAAMLLVNQLCCVVQPSESFLVRRTSLFVVNLVKGGGRLRGRTFAVCQRWLSEALEFSEEEARNDVLLALRSLLGTGPLDRIDRDARYLLNEGGAIRKHVSPDPDNGWTETNYLAISCLEAVLLNEENNGMELSPEFTNTIKDIALSSILSVSYETKDKLRYNKAVSLCLRILRNVTSGKTAVDCVNVLGQFLGLVQCFVFHGIAGYPPTKPQLLRPAAMNLPEAVHAIPRGRSFRNQKTKSKRQQPKRTAVDKSDGTTPDGKASNKCASDSDTSDTEVINLAHSESRVRQEVAHLLHAIVQNAPGREMFGYWPQIVATGSRGDARVLTTSILREPISKVRQTVLSALTELLISAKPFLVHAEDTDTSSFVTFFGTVSAMIKELHFALSLLLSTEKNAAVLTHALKCAASLAQGTPYARLKSGLATKLIRNCRPQLFHKDPTVRVAALSVFGALASSDPVTSEILGILGKRSTIDTDREWSRLDAIAGTGSDVESEVEIEFEDATVDDPETELILGDVRERKISSLLRVCLENASTEAVSVPVRLESLKLIGTLAFNAGDLVLGHLEIIAPTLAKAACEPEAQVALHASRVIETIAGCLGKSSTNDTIAPTFWNVIFEPVASLVRHRQTILREVACDCLGNVGPTMFAQFSRERIVLVITILFGAVRDEESAVRAAALRALGMLVALPSLEDDVGFLMDLADIVCLALDDRNLGVRVKAAWTLANLCDRLVGRGAGDEEVEPLPLDIVLPRLYRASVEAASDNDKVKCNAVRAIGSTLRLCPDRRVLKDASLGLETLMKCATLGNDMKVRWNACRALGFVLGHDPDSVLPSSWRDQVFPALSTLICHSPNFKVRTNAAWALSACEAYGKHIPALWKSVALALENSQHVPSYVEYAHRDALVQQLCFTLSHLAIHTTASDLPALWTEIGDHAADIAAYMTQFHERILPEKADSLVKAKMQLNKHAQSADTLRERQIADDLAKLFDRADCYENSDMPESCQ